MKKISFNNLGIRLFYLLSCLGPIGVFILIRINYEGQSQASFNTYLVLSMWLVVLLLIIFLNCFDWDIFIKNKKITVKNFISEKEMSTLNFEVKSISLITLFFSLYVIKFDRAGFYIFKHLPVKFSSFYTFKINAKKIEENFKTELGINY